LCLLSPGQPDHLLVGGAQGQRPFLQVVPIAADEGGLPGLGKKDGSGLGATTEAAAQTARVDLEQQILGPQLLDAVGGGQLTVPLRMGQHRPVARVRISKNACSSPGDSGPGGRSTSTYGPPASRATVIDCAS